MMENLILEVLAGNDTVSGNWTTIDGSSILDNATIMDGVTVADSALTNVTHVVHLHEHVNHIIYSYVAPTVCVFGICCNIINLMVLTQKQLKESPYTYLTGLAITDMSALFLAFVFLMIQSAGKTDYFWTFYTGWIFYPIVNICVNASMMITVSLTIERFLFVRVPLWAKDTCDRASAKFKVLSVLVIAALMNIPRFCVFYVKGSNSTVVDEWNSTSVVISYGLASTDFRGSEGYHVINWVYSICFHFLPLLILSGTNVYLVYAVDKARKMRIVLDIRNNREATWQREQTRLTITLISIVFLFIVCIIPSAFADKPISYLLFGSGRMTIEEYATSNTYLIIQYVANLLVYCNLSLNFVLYCAFNDKFRKVMGLMIQRWLNVLRRHHKDSSVRLVVNFKAGAGAEGSLTRNPSSSLQTNSTITGMHSKENSFHRISGSEHQELIKHTCNNNKDNQTAALINNHV